MERTTGRTTRAIQSAPQGAIYIWHSADTSHPSRLAALLGRGDLRFCSLQWLRDGCFRGMTDRSIVIDHHADALLNMDTIIALQGWSERKGCEVIF